MHDSGKHGKEGEKEVKGKAGLLMAAAGIAMQYILPITGRVMTAIGIILIVHETGKRVKRRAHEEDDI